MTMRLLLLLLLLLLQWRPAIIS